MRGRTLLALAMLTSAIAACGPGEVSGPFDGWDPAAIGWNQLPDGIIPVEHYQVPRIEERITYVFLGSNLGVDEVASRLRRYLQGEGLVISDRPPEDVLFSASGGNQEIVVWVWRFDSFETLGTELPDLGYLRDRGDIRVVLSITG